MIAFLWMLLAVCAAQPHGTDLRLQVEPLADGIVRAGEWSMVTVRLENPGLATTATITMVERLEGAELQPFERVVELPDGARKDVNLYYRAGPARRDREIRVRSDDGRDTTGHFEVEHLTSTAVGIGVIDAQPTGVSAVTHAWSLPVPGRAASTPTSDSRSVRVGSIPIASMPDRSSAYGSMSWLVWPSADPSGLTRAQTDALRAWVAGGGHLLLTVSETWRPLQESGLAQMLPVVSSGSATDVDLDELMGALGADLPRGQRGLAATSELRRPPGSAVWTFAQSQNGSPLWVASTWGRGTVHMLLADVQLEPLASLEDEQLWRALLWLPRPRGYDSDALRQRVDQASFDWAGPDAPEASNALAGALSMFDPSAVEPRQAWDRNQWPRWHDATNEWLSDIPGVAPLPLEALVAFALIYLIAIGPMDFFIVRLSGRRWLTWLSFPLIVSAFTVVAFIGSTLSKSGDAFVRRIEVVDLFPHAQALSGHSWFGAFSTHHTRIEIQPTLADSATSPLASRGFMTEPAVVSTDHGGVLAYGAETWTLAHAGCQWATEAPGIVSLRSQDGGETLEIRSDMRVTLRDVWLVRRSETGMTYTELGNLSPGGSLALSMDGERSEPPLGWAWKQLLHTPTGDGLGTLPTLHGAVVAGIADGPIHPIEIDGLDPTTESLTMVRIPLLPAVAPAYPWRATGGSP